MIRALYFTQTSETPTRKGFSICWELVQKILVKFPRVAPLYPLHDCRNVDSIFTANNLKYVCVCVWIWSA